MAKPREMEISNSEGLDAIFRAHYERIARVIGRVIHDQARAKELAVEIFLKWWRNLRHMETTRRGGFIGLPCVRLWTN
jgi:DNA-directed RNA polymerase specialized sigma24 family protein